MRWAIWREIWRFSCLPSLLYCISRKTVDTEYTYYSWCMTSTDIVKWRKNERLWTFWKGMIYMKILKKKWGSREKGVGGNEIHAPCACAIKYHITLVQNQWIKLRGTRVQYGFLLHTSCFLLINMLENFINFQNFQKISKL